MRSLIFLPLVFTLLMGAGCQSVDGLKATAPLLEPLSIEQLEAALLDLPDLEDIRRLDGLTGPGNPPFPEYLVLTRRASFWLLAGHGDRLVYLTYDAEEPMPESDYRLFLKEAERVHRHLHGRLPQVGVWSAATVVTVEFSRKKLSREESRERRGRSE